jgi:Ni/Fe-hydrogenase subunit HybB-like protein
MSTHDHPEATPITRWQLAVPENNAPLVTPTTIILAILSAIALTLAALRCFCPLGWFSAMNDAYPWGIWKPFNTMTLTALGSAPLGVGLAAWVFGRKRLHVVMRPAILSGFLFYATALISLGFDVGRPWNFWVVILPWKWNTESAMLEISICMPVYCAAFLAFELIPVLLERLDSTGNDQVRKIVHIILPYLRWIFPFMLTWAYVVPMMHQSSLGGLLLLYGVKLNPLWQTPFLPLLYLSAAIFCGIGFLTILLLVTCLCYKRPMDMVVLRELGSILSWTSFAFLALRFGDLIWRGQMGAAFAFDLMSFLFLLETVCILVPAVVLRLTVDHQTPRGLFQWSALTCVGGMLYRYIPTTIAYIQPQGAVYFPSVIELLMCIGYISLGVLTFVIGVKYFAILPGRVAPSDFKFRTIDWQRLAALASRDHLAKLLSRRGLATLAKRITTYAGDGWRHWQKD